MLQKKQSKRAKIKIIEIGDRVNIKQVPRKWLPPKLQPAYNDSFRMLDKVSDVIIKLRNIRSDNIKTLHTDRVRVMHEDNITPHLNPNVKRAYPVHDNGETRETRISLQPVESFPFFTEDTDDNSVDNSLNNSVDNSMESALQNSIEKNRTLAPHTQHKYNLRSTSHVHDLPRIMSKPVEYT